MDTKKLRRNAKIVSQYQNLFGSPTGKAVLYDMLKACRFLESSFDADPYVTAFNEGERSVVLSILKILKTDHASIMSEVQKMEDASE